MATTLRCLGGGVATAIALPAPAADAQATTAERTVSAEMYLQPENGGVRRWRVDFGDALPLLKRPATGADLVSSAPDGSVLANLGCTEIADQVWCTVRPFRGGARGFVLADHLVPATGPDGIAPMGKDDSRRRAGQRDFDASGELPCAQEQGQALGLCSAEVARGEGGDATIVVTFPNGFKRKLYFVHGEFVSASATMSGVGRDTEWSLQNGLHLIRVDDQRYEVPDALVFRE